MILEPHFLSTTRLAKVIKNEKENVVIPSFSYFSHGISGNHINDFLLITSRTPHYFIDALYHLWSGTFRHNGNTNVRLKIELKPAKAENCMI